MEPELKRRLDRIDERQLAFQNSHEQTRSELHGIRTDIRELRQAVGLSLPPVGEQGAAARSAAWHARAALRYALVAGAGAGATWLVDWLARVL